MAVRFGVITDVQYADKDREGTKNYRSLPLLMQAVDYFNSLDELDFIIHLGDIIDGNSNQSQTDQDLEQVTNAFKLLRKDRPTYHVIGNHCLNVSRELLYSALNLNNTPYYSFRVNKCHFIVVDSVDVSIKWPKDSPNHEVAKEYLHEDKNAKWWNGALMKGQKEWLRNELDKIKLENENCQEIKVIIFSHMPITEESSTPEHVMFDRKEILSLLEGYPFVVSWMNGHYHRGGYCFKNGVHHVTFEGVLEAPVESNAFGVVKIDEQLNSILIDGKGILTSRNLQL